LDIVLRVLATNQAPYIVQYCTVLAAYAESDFRSDVQQGDSIGVFQQKPQWWPSATKGTAAQCQAFIDKLTPIPGDPVQSCWQVQRWQPPDHYDPLSLESTNYLGRLPRISGILKTRKVPG
jgi:hypothetical protein